MKKTLVVTIVLALLATAAWAQPGGRGQGRGHGDCPMPQGSHQGFFGPNQGGPHQGMGPHEGMGRLLMFADEIGLTDDQQEKIKTLSLEHKMAMVDMHAVAKKAKLQMTALMHNDAPENEVIRAIEEASKVKMEIAKAKYLQRQAVKGILSEEQQDKLKELRQERRGQRFEGKGDGPRKSSQGRRFGR